jgi:DNA-binding MarR family transcriptional regulator
MHELFVQRYHDCRSDLMPRSAPDLTGSAEPVDPLALEQQVCFALIVAARSVLSIYRPLLEPMGLTHPQYLVLLALWGHSPQSVRELGGEVQLDSPSLSPLLKRLEAAGLITRTREPNNERQLRIELTDKGRDLRAEAERIPSAIIARLGMDISRLQDLHGSLTELIDAARTAGVEAISEPADV